MECTTWSPAPALASGAKANGAPAKDELLVTFDAKRSVRVLVVPALFDEANKLRRFTLSVMRALDEAGVDSALPDWPGCHESLALLSRQSLTRWRSCANQVAQHFGATHVLSLRAGALIAPVDLPGWRYAAVDGAKTLSGMLRAQMISEREAGRDATRADLMERGRSEGLVLGGWALGPALVSELETATAPEAADQVAIEQAALGGSGLWLRAEPDDNAEQAAALASIVINSVSDHGEGSS